MPGGNTLVVQTPTNCDLCGKGKEEGQADLKRCARWFRETKRVWYCGTE